ncbi:MAG: DUF2703 domain-containing protein [Deltaproteobacteria bacterium]|nr:DUF2703 domain-containing protein [Deltaproteobacteria bacterium]
MKRLEIEWKHLDKDGQTCERCGDTGDTVRRVVKELESELQSKGWEITFQETLLTDQEIPESNEIRLNGVPLEEILPQATKSENCCSSCEDLLGLPTLCRTIEYQGTTFEAIPPELIRQAVYNVINKS